VLIQDRPEAAVAESLHVSFHLPRRSGVGRVAAEPVRGFERLTRIEGIALAGRRALYVVDRDGRVEMHTLMLDES
jgi:hypothetical protein